MTQLRKCLFFIVFIFSLLTSYSQTSIVGTITDATDSAGVPYASVVIYRYQSNKIISYTQSDAEGNFSVEIDAQPQVVTLKANHLTYHLYQQDIVIGSDKSEKISLEIAMNPKTEQLEGVVIRGPIIVKEDTIIYDVEHWTEARDQTLEEVLAKIPGFKIKDDGSIEVNGKSIDKVLIDGEEVTNSGARLLTRSVAPEDVESVEVRLDEKNDKLKESLLDTKDYVVLDIKLKEELNKSLFGKIRGTLGYQRQLEVGGYFNAFSLKKKLKTHLFAEHDRFGEQTISLDQIKNIGAEALQRLFTTPADYNEFTTREAFQEEIYGFKNYTVAHKDIVGLTSRYSVSPSVDIYLGTYNAYAKNGKSRNLLQTLNNANITSQLSVNQNVTDYSSKNKLELRIDKGKVKARLDANAVLFDNNAQNPVNNSSQSLRYRYQDKHKSLSFYQNLMMEYAPSSKFGLRWVASYSSVGSDHAKNLLHNNPLYRNILFDENNNPVFHMRQITTSNATQLVSEILGQYSSRIGQTTIGVRFGYNQLEGGKKAVNNDERAKSSAVPQFSGNERTFSFHKWSPFFKHRIGLGSFMFQNEIALVNASYPNALNDHKSIRFFEFSTSVEFSSFDFSSISVSLSRRMSAFPLHKLVSGWDIVSFQRIAIPNQNLLTPTPEYSLQVFSTKKIENVNLVFDGAVAYGKMLNTERFLFDKTPFIATAYDQLSSEYLLVSFPITKNFKKIPLDIILEPEWMTNQTNNIATSGNSYLTKTRRTLLGIKFNTLFRDKPYDFFLYPKYSGFVFENELFDSSNKLEMFSVNCSANLDFFNKKILFTPSLRSVAFLGNINSNFTNISMRVESNYSKFRWFVSIDNLLNNTNFTTQTIFPTFFTSDNNSVFERYFKLGIEYKFK